MRSENVRQPLYRPVKVYVSVSVMFDSYGRMRPGSIQWIDGRYFDIDTVVDIRMASAKWAGGTAERYTCLINGKRCYLFFEKSNNPADGIIGRWFVEKKWDQ